MQGNNRPVAWCVWDHFQVVRSKTVENYVCFRLLPLLLSSAELGGVIPGQVASLELWSLLTLKCFVYSLSHRHIFFLEEEELLDINHLLFRSIDVLISALPHSFVWGCL